jgi:beta-glucosidase
MKALWSYKAARVWMIISTILIIFALVVNILGTAVFNGLLDTVFGGVRPIYDTSITSMYPALNASSKEQALSNAQDFNIKLGEEGFVLLKNENSALPLEEGAKISVFGKSSVNLSYGGSGSGGFDTSNSKNLYDSLENAGFTTNQTLKGFYEDDNASGAKRSANSSDLDSGDNQKIAVAETPQSKYTDAVKQSYGEYNDAALVVITRIGGEGFDLPRYQGTTEGAVSADSHYLELDANERDLLEEVCNGGFGHVIVLFNIPSSFEATFLTDPSYADFADKIDAAVWIGFTGSTGIVALGEILNGSVNPSGKLVDTWVADFTKDPTFVNFGTGSTPESSDKYDGGMYYFVDYEESIYAGYRYYETRGYTDGEDWYKENVVFPFGYGLSYTTFAWDVKQPADTNITKDGIITVEVEVTNTGSVPGKDIVQLYASAPYQDGGIEKSHKVLVGYAKTELLAAGEKGTVTIEFDPYNVASYDYNEANGNGFYGYELESGKYTLYISQNAHESVSEIVCNLASDIQYDADPVTGNTVENRYTGIDGVMDSDAQLSTKLSRADWEGTWPDEPAAAERAGSERLYEEIKDITTNNPIDYSELEYPWFGEEVTLKVRDLLPKETPETSHKPIITYDDERWDAILDACSEEDMINLFNYGAYHTLPIENIGLPATLHGDGPAGFTSFLNREQVTDTCQYVSEPVMAATWNVELMEELGRTMGEEGILGDKKTGTPYSSIYAPGVNIHRSPFGGRCSEYFSEDPYISGIMAGAEIRGCQEMGVVCMVKHFAANEQETHRSIGGDCSWLTEQALREIYLKSFELAVKTGESRGLMTSFNRIGTRWTGGDYRLVTNILREEWGFNGTVICDFNTIPQYMNCRQMAYAGGDLDLATLSSSMWTDCDTSDTGDAIVLRRTTKNILYSFVNSNAMNSDVVGYRMANWRMFMYIADAALVIGIAAWGTVVIISKKRKAE